MDMSLATLPWHPPLYVTAAILLTLAFPLVAIRPLRRVGSSHWQAGPLLIALPLVGNAALSYLLLRRVIRGLAVIGHPSPAAAAAGVGEALIPLRIGATASVVTAAIGFVILWRGARVAQKQAAKRSLRGSIFALLTTCIMALAGVFVASSAVFHCSSAQFVFIYYLISAAAAICATLVLAIVVQLFTLSRCASARSPEQDGAHPAMPLISLGVAGGIATIITILTWLVQARCLHLAMYGAA
jgi:hypothetical protein